MELPIFTHLSPVGSFSAHYYGIPGSDHKSPSPDSDNSMDAEVHEVLKLKQAAEEDFFSWAGEIRVSLDADKNETFNSISNEEESKTNDQNPIIKATQQSVFFNERNNNQFGKDQTEQNKREQNYIKVNPFTALKVGESGSNKEFDLYTKIQEQGDFCKEQNRMGNKEEERFGKNSGQYPKPSGKLMMKGGNVARDASEAGVRTEIDIFLEKSQMAATANQGEEAPTAAARKRKIESATVWQGGKIARVTGSSNNQRDMISAGRISSGWQVDDDLEIDLPGELASPSYNMSDALLSLPVFKEEAPSPTGGTSSSPPWLNRQNNLMTNGMAINNNTANCSPEQHSPNVGQIQGQNCTSRTQQQGMVHVNSGQMGQMGMAQHNQQMASFASGGAVQQGATTDQTVMDVANGLLLCSPHSSIENFANCNGKPLIQQMSEVVGSPDNRFQYVLAAATSIATKCNEDTLTYLNQCQSYEIKFKKLGDLSYYRGKIVKSIIRICFHERRLQYAEREQMTQWQSERPGERIVEVDVPLSYGLMHVYQPTEQPLLNTVEFYWDPVKEAGVYIKVNCISTEFTAKKHGGEKGVPFRIQVETFLPGDGPPGTVFTPKGTPPQPDKRLHAAACQIKVFKLKGADRKHKQDREKILRRPECEREKYQPSYECTVFTDLPNDAVFSSTAFGIGQPYSPEGGPIPPRPSAPPSASPPRIDAPLQQLVSALPSPHADVKLQQSLSRVNSHGSSLDCDEESPSKPLLQGAPVSPGDTSEITALSEHATASDTRMWLSRHGFSSLMITFSNFYGADLLRLSRDDLIQICSLADGIRLYNALHTEHAPARLTLYAKKSGEKPFSAIYLRTYQTSELKRKLLPLLQDGSNVLISEIPSFYLAGPNGIKINLTDEVIQNLRNDSMFCLDTIDKEVIMKPT